MLEIFVNIFEMCLKLLKADDVGLMLFEPVREPLVVRRADAVQVK
jgi:hypothetical protein